MIKQSEFSPELKRDAKEYFMIHKKVNDTDIHNLAEKLGVSPHDLESAIYSVLSDYVAGTRTYIEKKAYDLGYAQATELFEKEANWRKWLATGGLAASLLNPMKGLADDAMLAAAKEEAAKMLPSITQEVTGAVDKLPFPTAMAAKVYGIDDIAKNLATSKANLEMMEKYNMPTHQGKDLRDAIMSTKNKIMAGENIDIPDTVHNYHQIQDFIDQSNKEIQDYLPPILSAKGPQQ